jgi:HD-like signal output (HDOD) protein/prolyl-tRNA editing enzyme YbaK/EbsC (Cys-tRNA(Pro) deacylase)
MSLATSIQNHLAAHGVPYTVVTRGVAGDADAELQIPLSKTVKSLVLQDRDGLLVVVFGADRALNIPTLQQLLQRSIELVPPQDHVTLFEDRAPTTFSPFAKNYSLRVLVDTHLAEQDLVYFENGNLSEFVTVDRAGFRQLHASARFELNFAQPMSTGAKATDTRATPATQFSAKAERMKFRVQKTTELPPMPEMAQKIFSLNSNPYARIQDLAQIVEVDPSFAAQIIRYARSPFYGYRGKINSIHDAVARVLGYDLVMNIALGLASAAPFKIARNGPLGLNAFWRHATYSAVLTQSLCGLVSKGPKPRAGMAYLAGLLHNFGFLVLGHVYPVEFKLLNEAVAAQPQTPVAELEAEIVGVTHGEIGAWLMESWNMPAEIIAVVSEHHNADYSGHFAEYARLVHLVDHLLKKFDLGDAPSSDLPAGLAQSLGLTDVQIDTKFNKLLESRDELDSIAQHLAA